MTMDSVPVPRTVGAPELAALPPGPEEQAYRRGYRDGFGQALATIVAACEGGAASLAQAAEVGWDHWEDALGGWARDATPAFVEPPASPLDRPPARRTRRQAGPGSLRLRFLVLRRDGFRCQLCGATAADGVRLEVDHRVPRAKGGTDAEANLWTLCRDCNAGKSDLDLAESGG
jgi:hypothetical protein